MAESSVTVTVGGRPVADADLSRIRSVVVSEAINGQTQVSVVASCVADNTSNWTSPLDSLVQPFAQFQVRIDRGRQSLVVPARATSCSWSLQAGGLSTLSIAGLDASADLDKEDHDASWGGVSDGDIATVLLAPLGAPRVGSTPPSDGTDAFTPHQHTTDWQYLKLLAGRNDFDVYLDNVAGVPTPVFEHINPLAQPQTTLDLGYGELAGTASVEVQLVAGQNVQFTHGTADQPEQQVAGNDGTGNAMGTQSLGGAVTVLRDRTDLAGTQTPEVAARVLAERSAFAASLSVTLTTPEMPLLRARRTVYVRGLGTSVSGLWLVRSVRHSIDQGGHTQAVTLTRNALGDSGPNPASGVPGVLAGAGASGGSL